MHRIESAEQVDETTVSFQAKIWGISKRFEAEIVEQRPDERIEWNVTEGYAHTGVVTFHSLSENLTRVDLSLDIQPSNLIDKASRGMRFAKRAVRGDLHRFKAYVELDKESKKGSRRTIEDGKVKRARRSGSAGSSSRGRSRNGSDPKGGSKSSKSGLEELAMADNGVQGERPRHRDRVETAARQGGEFEDYSVLDPEDIEDGPDVLLDVPVVKVDEVDLEVEDLRAQVSVTAEVRGLVELSVGVDARLGKVELNIQGVEAQALVKARLDNVSAILDRVLLSLDRNPELLESVGEAVERVGGGTGRLLAESGEAVGTSARAPRRRCAGSAAGPARESGRSDKEPARACRSSAGRAEAMATQKPVKVRGLVELEQEQRRARRAQRLAKAGEVSVRTERRRGRDRRRGDLPQVRRGRPEGDRCRSRRASMCPCSRSTRSTSISTTSTPRLR